MKYVWEQWEWMKKELAPGRAKLVFLDFDGTLVSIADSPDAVRLDSRTKKILETLARVKHVHLAVVSGRPLKELRRFLHSKNMILIGNHGLEMQGGGMQLPPDSKKARKMQRLIGMLSQKFKMVFGCYPGIWVENKHYTMSLHFRKLPRGQGTVFDELVKFYKKKYKHYPLTWIRGKKVVEVRPSVYWGKGDAVKHLLHRFRGSVPVAIGDDRVDEDMFKALKEKGGISIRVGRSRSSLADYYLSSPYDVKVFLQKLCP